MSLVRPAGLAWVPPFSKALVLPPGEVDIWKVCLSRCPVSLANAFLSPEERKRALAITDPKVGLLFPEITDMSAPFMILPCSASNLSRNVSRIGLSSRRQGRHFAIYFLDMFQSNLLALFPSVQK